MTKAHVHIIRNENGKMVVYRLKPPAFHAVFNSDSEELENIIFNLPVEVGKEGTFLKKAKAFVKSQLRKKGISYEHQ